MKQEMGLLFGTDGILVIDDTEKMELMKMLFCFCPFYQGKECPA